VPDYHPNIHRIALSARRSCTTARYWRDHPLEAIDPSIIKCILIGMREREMVDIEQTGGWPRNEKRPMRLPTVRS
jgi:hypothetical protein